MLFLKTIIALAFSVAAQLICAENALAWGPGVHTVTALSLLGNIDLILPSIAGIITSAQHEFLYGCLAADFFVGKTRKKKSGYPHNWEGGFQFLSKAGDDREAAFAYGFLSHLAADVVAHNFFVPNLVAPYPRGKKMAHLFFEIKADYLIGPDYTKIAKDVLSGKHQRCDNLLKIIAKEKKKGLKAKKRLFKQSVNLTDYLYTMHDFLFDGKAIKRNSFHEYLALMVDLSCDVLKDFLKHPEASFCLSYNPIGRPDLHCAKKRKSTAN